MKEIRLLDMILCLTILLITFSFDENVEDLQNSKEEFSKDKLLIESMRIGADTSVCRFNYNENNRLITLFKDFNSPEIRDRDIYKYIWYDDRIVGFTSRGEQCGYLSEDLIQSYEAEESNINLAYNSNKKLRRVNEEKIFSDSISNFVFINIYKWNNNKLLGNTFRCEEGDTIYTVTNTVKYSDKTCKGFNPIFIECFQCIDFGGLRSFYILEAHPELIGFRSNLLPEEIVMNDHSVTYIDKYSYVLDKDGYIVNCLCESNLLI